MLIFSFLQVLLFLQVVSWLALSAGGCPCWYTNCLPYFLPFLWRYILLCVWPCHLHLPFLWFLILHSFQNYLSQRLHLCLPVFQTLLLNITVYLNPQIYNMCTCIHFHPLLNIHILILIIFIFVPALHMHLSIFIFLLPFPTYLIFPNAFLIVTHIIILPK